MRRYLDWNATAIPDPRVIEGLREAFASAWGNASSLHADGRRAAEQADTAREELAGWTSSRPQEWILTSGSTEALHTGILGTWLARSPARRIVSSQGEHEAVLEALSLAERLGAETFRVPLDGQGCWDPEAVLRACDADTALVALIWAGNETGAVSDVQALAEELSRREIPLLLDATQAFGRLPVDLSRLSANLITVSGHKIGGPKGIGALFVRSGTPWLPWMRGGGQERGRRGGTTNAPGAAGFAEAIRIVRARGIPSDWAAQRTRFEALLQERLPEVQIASAEAERLPNTTCALIPGVDSQSLLNRLDALGFAVSSGSACSSGRTEPSHVLTAMGIPDALAHGALRISTGPATPWEDLAALLDVLPREAARIRSLGAGWLRT